MVAMPLIMIASWGFRPMISGKTKVAPNMATTCWAPSPMVLPQESRSSGATTSLGPTVLPSPWSFQPRAIRLLLVPPVVVPPDAGGAHRAPRIHGVLRHIG